MKKKKNKPPRKTHTKKEHLRTPTPPLFEKEKLVINEKDKKKQKELKKRMHKRKNFWIFAAGTIFGGLSISVVEIQSFTT